jgi:hypothetical protein
MSTTYNIKVPIELIISESRLEKLRSFGLTFTLLEILPKEEMLEILAAKLKEEGFAGDGNLLTISIRGNETTFNLEELKAAVTINLPTHYDIVTNDDTLANRNLIETLNNCINNNVPLPMAFVDKGATREYAEELANLSIEVKGIINAAIKATYKDAVITKASQLGNLEHISETRDDGVYKVRIEIEG